jgi:Tol biopolymer transport system component
MAFVEFPEGILARSRMSGDERRQLTFPPMRVLNPQWAPDGGRLAFQASASQGAPDRIYLLPRDGGPPALAAPDRSDTQAYPSWMPDGGSILYSSLDAKGATRQLVICDLKSRSVSALPGTAGLWYGQISPDGRRVAAIRWDKSQLVLYDLNSHGVQLLADAADYPQWSKGGEFVYFRTPYYAAGNAPHGIFRWRAATGKVEQVVAAPDFPLTGLFGIWSGVAPDGAPLVLRNLGTRDIYRLDLDLP